jgi:hypothetical protein
MQNKTSQNKNVNPSGDDTFLVFILRPFSPAGYAWRYALPILKIMQQ